VSGKGKPPTRPAPIGDLIADLAAKEHEAQATVTRASAAPSLSDRDDFIYKWSKLMAGPDVCAAIYANPRTQRVLCSNNTGSSDHGGRILGILRGFGEGKVPEEDCIWSLASANAKHCKFPNIVDMRRTLRAGIMSSDIPEGAAKDMIRRVSASLEAYASDKTETRDEKLRVYQESVGALMESHDPSLAAIKRNIITSGYPELYSDARDVAQAFSKREPRDLFISIMERKVDFIPGPAGRHAEMNLLPEVIKEGEGTIITSKSLCNPCNIYIEEVNKTLGTKIKTIGTHAKTYPGWQWPERHKGSDHCRDAFRARIDGQRVAKKEHKYQSDVSTSKPRGKDAWDKRWYGEEDIIPILNRTCNGLATVHNGIGSIEQFDKVVGDIWSKGGKHVIPLNINCESGKFDGRNHWTGLYINSDLDPPKISYIDPMGRDVGPEIRDRLRFLGGVIETPLTGRAVQTLGIRGEGGNDYDCGPFSTYLLGHAARLDGALDPLLPAADLSSKASVAFGQSIRRRLGLVDRALVLGMPEEKGLSGPGKGPVLLTGGSAEVPPPPPPPPEGEKHESLGSKGVVDQLRSGGFGAAPSEGGRGRMPHGGGRGALGGGRGEK